MGKRLKKIFSLTGVEPGMTLLDIGCGRGELVLKSASARANAWGIDTSTDAINLCKQTLDFWEKNFPHIKKYAHFANMDACELIFKNNSFDLVILSDVIEHLQKSRLPKVLDQISRVLKVSGKVIIHTSPNKYYLPFSGIFFLGVSLFLSIFNRSFKDNCQVTQFQLRKYLPPGLNKQMHINEQSSFGLKRSLLQSGLRAERIWFELNPHYINRFFPDRRGFQIINFFRKIVPIKHFFYADLFCIARLKH